MPDDPAHYRLPSLASGYICETCIANPMPVALVLCVDAVSAPYSVESGVNSKTDTQFIAQAGQSMGARGRLISVAGFLILEFLKLGCHRRIVPGQLLDRYILGLVVCEAQVPIRSEEGVLGLLQVVY